jgi:hypothetical protein
VLSGEEGEEGEDGSKLKASCCPLSDSTVYVMASIAHTVSSKLCTPTASLKLAGLPWAYTFR